MKAGLIVRTEMIQNTTASLTESRSKARPPLSRLSRSGHLEPKVEPAFGDFQPPTRSQAWFRDRLVAATEQLAGTAIRWVDAEGPHGKAFESDSQEERIEIQVLRPEAYRMIALHGELGFGDAVVEGFVHCNRMAALVRLLARNVDQLDRLGRRRSNWRNWLARFRHWSRRNNQKNSRRNIAAHYDLSNDFFGLWLDPTMSYSSAVFSDLPGGNAEATGYQQSRQPLETASQEKLRRLCEKLDLKPGDHLVEIGCGWGGLALFAAQHYGCRVTGVTLSQEQLKFAQERVLQAGLQDRIDLRLCDYRELEGQYDKLVSVEMIEAVGHQYLDQYFQKCCQLLKPEGRMAIQAITIAEHRLAGYLKNVDFIREYIFPGGSLPSVGSMMESVARVTDFRPTHLEDIGLHYAETLRRWRLAFHEALTEIRQLDFDERFIRMWDYYLAYCEGAFEEGHIGTVQLVLDRSRGRHQVVETGERLGWTS